MAGLPAGSSFGSSLSSLASQTVALLDFAPSSSSCDFPRSGAGAVQPVALALAPLVVEPDQEHAFITKFLSNWGQALDQVQRRRRRPGR